MTQRHPHRRRRVGCRRCVQTPGRVVAQWVEREKSLAVPLPATAGRRIEGYLASRSRVRFSPALPALVLPGAHGRGRAPPGTVAQQRSRERGVAARLPMPDEGRSVRGDDVETRVRFPPARAPLTRRRRSSTSALERVAASRFSMSMVRVAWHDCQAPRRTTSSARSDTASHAGRRCWVTDC